jgi:hypothetical protein
MKWFEADTIWDSFYKITTKEDFVEKFVVESKFHNNVPKDIVDAFETVSYLLANSYYHYSLLDVALNKMLLIIEMAVKLKAKELHIPLKLPPNKYGKAIDKKLFKLIDEVCKEAKLEFLIPDFDRARNLRNSFMHPEGYSVMGIFSATKKNFVHFNNVINQLFLNSKEISLLVSNRAVLKEKFEAFRENFSSKLFILNDSNQKALINDIHYHKYFAFDQKELLFLLVNPLLIDVYDRLTNHKFGEPYLLILKEFDFSDSKITGVDLDNNQIEIYETVNLLDWEQLKIYLNEMDLVSENDKQLFNAHRSSEVLSKIDKIVYNDLWK